MKPETLRAEYPCCGRRMRLPDHGIPLERWTRRCQGCSTTWDVRRAALVVPIEGMEVSVLEFTDTKSTDYRRKYGT